MGHCKEIKFMTLGSLLEQGVVTHTSSVESFATGIKIFDQRNMCLIA